MIIEYDNRLEGIVDPETGEITDAGIEQLEQMDLENKLENVGCWIKDLQAEAEAIKADIKRQTDRMKRKERKAERLKDYLLYKLDAHKFETARVAVSFRKTESVYVDDGDTLDTLPDQYKRIKTTVEPDKTAIKAALKAGEQITGCDLVTKISCTVK